MGAGAGKTLWWCEANKAPSVSDVWPEAVYRYKNLDIHSHVLISFPPVLFHAALLLFHLDFYPLNYLSTSTGVCCANFPHAGPLPQFVLAVISLVDMVLNAWSSRHPGL